MPLKSWRVCRVWLAFRRRLWRKGVEEVGNLVPKVVPEIVRDAGKNDDILRTGDGRNVRQQALEADEFAKHSKQTRELPAVGRLDGLYESFERGVVQGNGLQVEVVPNDAEGGRRVIHG